MKMSTFTSRLKKRIKSLFSGFCIINYMFPLLVYAGQSILVLPGIQTDITIDGNLNESQWHTAAAFSEFRTYAPDFGHMPTEKTVAYMTYDKNNLFIAFRCFDKSPRDIKRTVTKRDNLGNDDWTAMEVDVTGSAQMSYLFRVNPYGIQEDGIVNQDVVLDLSYDAVWKSAAVADGEGYTVEMAIPFSALRLPAGDSVMVGVSFSRCISRKSEIMIFPEYRPQNGSLHTQRQKMILTELKIKRILEFIPAVTTTQKQIRSDNGWEKHDGRYEFGLDNKISLTPDLMLNVTYNPDFSQIEADAGTVDANLRYSVYYPEKRPFFQEGQEQFSLSTQSYLYTADLKKIFHSRNIVDPLFGAKISGKTGPKNSVSALFAADEYSKTLAKETGFGPEKNAYYGIFRYRRSLCEDGYAGVFYGGKNYGNAFNHVGGFDGRSRLGGTSRIEYQAFGSTSRTPFMDHSDNGYAYAVKYSYTTRDWNIHVGYRDVSTKFNTETGYMQRNGVRSLPVTVYYNIFRDSSIIQKISLLWNGTFSMDRFSDKFERTHNWFGMELYFPRQTWTWFGFNYRDEIFQGKRFDRKTAAMGFYSQLLKRLFIAQEIWIQKEVFYDPKNPFQGEAFGAYSNLTIQPSDNITHETEFSYSGFRRASNHETVYDYQIIREKLTYQFNKHFFIRGIGEYNSYRRKITLNFLMSYTYIPGTVIYLGYGSMFEKQDMQDHYRPVNRVMFLKASYLVKI